MLAVVIWGVIQGITEFLPVSSDGHLVVIPALLNEMGLDVQPPTLASTAILHLGTLAAMLIYFRHDLAKVLHFRDDPEGRKIALLVAIGTIPAVIFGLPLEGELNALLDHDLERRLGTDRQRGNPLSRLPDSPSAPGASWT